MELFINLIYFSRVILVMDPDDSDHTLAYTELNSGTCPPSSIVFRKKYFLNTTKRMIANPEGNRRSATGFGWPIIWKA